jgi:hypothetical protein
MKNLPIPNDPESRELWSRVESLSAAATFHYRNAQVLRSLSAEYAEEVAGRLFAVTFDLEELPLSGHSQINGLAHHYIDCIGEAYMILTSEIDEKEPMPFAQSLN